MSVLIAGDIRGVYCPYYNEIRDWDVVPIHKDALINWSDSLEQILDESSSEDLRNSLNGVKIKY